MEIVTVVNQNPPTVAIAQLTSHHCQRPLNPITYPLKIVKAHPVKNVKTNEEKVWRRRENAGNFFLIKRNNKGWRNKRWSSTRMWIARWMRRPPLSRKSRGTSSMARPKKMLRLSGGICSIMASEPPQPGCKEYDQN